MDSYDFFLNLLALNRWLEVVTLCHWDSGYCKPRWEDKGVVAQLVWQWFKVTQDVDSCNEEQTYYGEHSDMGDTVIAIGNSTAVIRTLIKGHTDFIEKGLTLNCLGVVVKFEQEQVLTMVAEVMVKGVG